MSSLQILPKHDGTTLNSLADFLFFKDTPPPPGKNVLYVLKLTEVGTGTSFRHPFDLNTASNAFRLPAPKVEYNKIYRIRLLRYDFPTNIAPVPAKGYLTDTSDPVIVYTPAFPHTLLQSKQRSFDKKTPYVASVMNEVIAFTKIAQLEAYKIKIIDPSDGTVLYNKEHNVQNQEYYFFPSNVPNIGFDRTYGTQARVKVTKYRKHFGPVCYIRTPPFPQPVFTAKTYSLVNPATTAVGLTAKIPGVTSYEYQLAMIEPKPLTQNLPAADILTLTVNDDVINVALDWFNGPAFQVMPNTTYWIRCRGRRQTSPLVDQEGPFSLWTKVTTQP